MNRLGLCRWGALEASVERGRLLRTRPWPEGAGNAALIEALPALVYSEHRVDRPYVRASWLKHRELADGQGRGSDPLLAVDWNTALMLVAEELRRVRDTHGHRAIFGGSCGHASTGRLHDAHAQLRRFLASFGGFTDQIGHRDCGAAATLLPHVLGNDTAHWGVQSAWNGITADTDTLIVFGGLQPDDRPVHTGDKCYAAEVDRMRRAQAEGLSVIVVSPMGDDISPFDKASHIPIRPNTDVALMLALCHEVLLSGAANLDFLLRHCTGAKAFLEYVYGTRDRLAKSADWAATRCGIAARSIRELANTVCTGRVMLYASESLQHAPFGEQPCWMLIALAAVTGQIGLPGGGFSLGRGPASAAGTGGARRYLPALPVPDNRADSRVPVSRLIDMLEHPGKTIPFNGGHIEYPDARLLYWSAGNPFQHTPNLFALARAWSRPETVIVQDAFWTATARRADIVLPTTTDVERNDIGIPPDNSHVLYAQALIAPVAAARNDRDIFADVAERTDCSITYTDDLDEMGWLRRLWAQAEQQGIDDGLPIPDFDTLRSTGPWPIPESKTPVSHLASFRQNPETCSLATPSGRIELYSETLAGFALADAPPHPTWFTPPWMRQRPPLTTDPAAPLILWMRPASGSLHGAPAGIDGKDKNDSSSLLMHPHDAAVRQIGEGDHVIVYSGAGACPSRAHLSDACLPGVISMQQGPAFRGMKNELFDPGGNPHSVTPDCVTSALSQACAFQGCAVRVKKPAHTVALREDEIP